jgi:hypothetical protein
MTENFHSIEDLLTQFPFIEGQSPHDNLIIYTPGEEHTGFYHDLCRFYLGASLSERTCIQEAIKDKEGILNNLLGYIYQCAERVQKTQNNDWFHMGLSAASMRGNGPDFRDFYLALAELYAVALKAGIDPKDDFNAINGGVPKDFHTFAVLKERLARDKKT